VNAADSPAAASCGICGLIGRIRGLSFADFVAELEHHYVILGDAQFYRGYCALLFKRHLTELHRLAPETARSAFDEVLAVARAIDIAVHPIRLNYENLGNQEPHIHWHIFPRFVDDPMRLAPVWMRPEAERKVTLDDREHRALIESLRAELARIRR
jgi:diadenosine tetraphosphate (Ap4A) HIT family hydrolase